MATRYHNVTGELTQELLAVGDNIPFTKISLSNVGTVTGCKVDVYIEKKLLGRFYLFKGVKMPLGGVLIYEGVKFNNKAGEFGLYCKLTKAASEVPAVDIILS